MLCTKLDANRMRSSACQFQGLSIFHNQYRNVIREVRALILVGLLAPSIFDNASALLTLVSNPLASPLAQVIVSQRLHNAPFSQTEIHLVQCASRYNCLRSRYWNCVIENSAAPQFLFNKSFYHLLLGHLCLKEVCIWCLTIAKKQTSDFCRSLVGQCDMPKRQRARAI